MTRYDPSALLAERSNTWSRSFVVIRRRLPCARRVAEGSTTTFSGRSVVRWFSTWKYPSAQNRRVATAIAAVGATGLSRPSKLTNHMTPFSSRAVNPGATPAPLPRMTLHFPGAGPSVVSGPRVTSSVDSGFA